MEQLELAATHASRLVQRVRARHKGGGHLRVSRRGAAGRPTHRVGGQRPHSHRRGGGHGTRRFFYWFSACKT